MMHHCSRISLAITVFALSSLVSLGEAARVDATEGRDYRVTKEHGPWMIFVASFHKPGVDRPDELETDREDETVAREAAKRLVLELRKQGVPAYVFELKKEREVVMTRNRMGETQKRRTQSDDAQISVMAGNYSSITSDVAVKTLAWIKRYKPASFGDLARFRVTPGRQGPLAGAFLTINPLLSQEEVMARTIDESQIKLLKKLNAGNDFPVTECGGNYTLIVKEFSGRSGMKSNARVQKSWNESEMLDSGRYLGRAGFEAWQLCASLRNRGVDAYLWHEEFRSVVTVGSFTGPSDAGIRAYKRKFGAEQRRDPKSGVVQVVYKTEPPFPNGIIPSNAEQYWHFDVAPRLMAVPKIPTSRGLFGLGR